MPIVTLQVLEGIDKGRVFRELPTPVTIGREEGNSLRLNDERVSRFHVKIQEDQDKVVLTDLESTNGTKVNGQRVIRGALLPGDELAFAGEKYRVEMGPGEPDPEPSDIHGAHTEVIDVAPHQPDVFFVSAPDSNPVQTASDSDVRMLDE